MRCSICGKEIKGRGNSPYPIPGGKCCDECNYRVVVPVRVFLNSIEKGDVAILIKPKGVIENIKVTEPLTLEQLQAAVEGYIAITPSPIENYIFVVNEEGKLKGLPFNKIVYLLFGTEFVGNVLVVHKQWVE